MNSTADGVEAVVEPRNTVWLKILRDSGHGVGATIHSREAERSSRSTSCGPAC
jgi:hypothetical protein